MKLSTAIVIVQQDLDDPGSTDHNDLREAEKLLIHAGKRVLYYRRDAFSVANAPLDGETKE